MSKLLSVVIALMGSVMIYGQTTDTAAEDQKNTNEVISSLIKNDSVKKPVQNTRFMIDGVAGVIGDYVVLDSDIAKQLDVVRRQGNNANLSKCELIESILQEKMYAHHAIQDSITVSDAEINGRTEQQIEYFKSELGTDEAVARYYRRDNIQQVRDELNRSNRDLLLSQRMQERLTESIEITPEEVRQFFSEIPKEERPLFNTEVEMSQIIVIPKPTQQAVDDVIERLNRYRDDVLNNGASFAALATLHSDDIGTERNGGVLSMKRNDPFVKEFKDQAFSLQEGEISEPFETGFGWHILLVDKVRGQVRDVRHILLEPFVSTAQVNDARQKLDEMRDKIILDEIEFGEAAKQISDQEETAKNGGKFINPRTGDVRLEVDKLPSELASQLQFLEEGGVSGIFQEKDEQDRVVFKIIYVEDKIDDHIADYSLDYLKIKNLAMNKKKIDAIKDWREEKLKDTYIKIGPDFKDCDFNATWTAGSNN
ncbi:MAG: peptidylprolyl isomerase [Nonlabens sp.]